MYNPFDDRYDDIYDDCECGVITEEMKRHADFGRAISNGTAYEKFGYDPFGTEKEKAERYKLEYKPGIHTRAFKGRTDDIQAAVNRFHERMDEKYEEYEYIGQSQGMLQNCQVMYITFRNGNKRDVNATP